MSGSQQTTISSMTIEDQENRRNLLRLEGGQKAFEQREKRYK